MIAPRRDTDGNLPARRGRQQLGRARQFIAATLLRPVDDDPPPPIAGWQAWLLVGWMVVAAAVYALSMAGLLK